MSQKLRSLRDRAGSRFLGRPSTGAARPWAAAAAAAAASGLPAAAVKDVPEGDMSGLQSSTITRLIWKEIAAKLCRRGHACTNCSLPRETLWNISYHNRSGRLRSRSSKQMHKHHLKVPTPAVSGSPSDMYRCCSMRRAAETDAQCTAAS